MSQRVSKPLIKKIKIASSKSILTESRYPKIIYAFKKFFSILKKIIQSNEIFDEILQNDIYANKDKHNLAEFENILKEVFFVLNLVSL